MNKKETLITDKELNNIYKMIAKNIKYYRLYNNSKFADEYGRISQEKLAELCDLSRSMIANIESAKVQQGFSIATVAVISKALNIPFEDFFKEHDFSKRD